MNYRIEQLQLNEIDLIQPLWEKLNRIHFDVTQDFKDRYKSMNWEKRKMKLTSKSGEIRIDTVLDDDSRIIGYCISTIDKENHQIGEIDSIFIEEAYRKSGLGKQLINNAIDWLKEKGTTEQKLLVCVGNEKVLAFYKQFNFFPLHIVLQRIE